MMNIVLDSGYKSDDLLKNRIQAKQWAENNGGTDNFIKLAKTYWSLCLECGNVNPLIAYAQAALKTNFGKYDEDFKEELNNPAGLKVLEEGEDDDFIEVYETFKTIEDGVSAHLDHLALYAGATEYPKEQTKDPRHFSYLYGVCKEVEDLSGKWDSSSDYGSSILSLVTEILNTKIDNILKEEKNNLILENDSESSSENNGTESSSVIDEKDEEIYLILEKLKENILELLSENKKLSGEVSKYKKIIGKLNKCIVEINNEK